MSDNTFADQLNELLTFFDEVDTTPILERVREHLPKTRHPENTLRILLQILFVETLRNASREEKTVFIASVVADLLSDEEKATIRDSANGYQKLDTPAGVDGNEFIRMFKEVKNGKETGFTIAVVDSSALPPEEWGMALHDIAKNVVNGAVEKKLVSPNDRVRTLNRIANAFREEHKKPTDTPKPYKVDLDS
jgi:hypothetical protein